jgi:hypothetical protein
MSNYLIFGILKYYKFLLWIKLPKKVVGIHVGIRGSIHSWYTLYPLITILVITVVYYVYYIITILIK